MTNKPGSQKALLLRRKEQMAKRIATKNNGLSKTAFEEFCNKMKQERPELTPAEILAIWLNGEFKNGPLD